MVQGTGAVTSPPLLLELGQGWPSAVHPRAASLSDKGQLLRDIPEKEQSQNISEVKLCHKLFQVQKCSTRCLSCLSYSENNFNDVEIVEKLHELSFSPGSFHTRCGWGSVLCHQAQGLEHVGLTHFLLEQSRIQEQRCLWHLPSAANLPL